MKTIGLLGGMSHHSTLLYYRLINTHIQRTLGSPTSAPLILHSFNFASITPLLTTSSWPALASRFIAAGKGLRAAGAQGIAIGCNIGHKVAEEVERGTGLPVLHIGDAVGRVVKERGVGRVGLLATRAVMEEGFISEKLKGVRVKEVLVPGEEEWERMDGVIFGELAAGRVEEETRRWMDGLVGGLVGRGAEGLILACTDLQFVVQPERVSVPVLETLELHAKYIAEWAMNEE